MTVGIYIRVSTEEQVRDGFSISAQREKLKAYCVAQDWDNFKFYVDEGISAKDTNRPQLTSLINDVKEERINTVLVYRLDRLTRSVMDLYTLLELFDKYNCAFKSATEVYDTSTAMGRMFITIVAALAQWERENLGERVRMGQIEKARQGKYSAKAPFGFDKDKDDVLIINPDEKEILLNMIDKIEKGYSIRRISYYLDDLVKPIRGYKWHVGSILSIVSNPALYGAITWCDEITEDAHEPIITKEKFNYIQKLLYDRQNFKKRKVYSIHIYQMKLVCPNCGNRLTCERNTYFRKKDKKQVENNSYRCQVCALKREKALNISEIKVEKAFLKYIHELKLKKQDDKIIDTVLTTSDSLLQKQIKNIEHQREKFQKAWSMDLISDNEFTLRMNETKLKLENLHTELDLIPSISNNEIDENTKIEIVEDIKNNWENLSPKEKKEFTSMFIERIEVQKINNDAIITNIEFF